VPLLWSTGRGGSSVVRSAETIRERLGRDCEGRLTTSGVRSGDVSGCDGRNSRCRRFLCRVRVAEQESRTRQDSSVEVRGPLLSGCYVFVATHVGAQWLLYAGPGPIVASVRHLGQVACGYCGVVYDQSGDISRVT